MDFKNLLELSLAAARAEKNAPVAYSVSDTEKYSAAEVDQALRDELNNLACDYKTFRENKNTIFRLIEETIDEVLPTRVMEQFERFADIRTVPQGDKAVFTQRISDAARKRAKTFVTRVGLAGRYETFMLDGQSLEVQTAAIGAAARLGLEEFLDGRWTWADMTSIVLEGMDEYIYREIATAMGVMVASLPAANKTSHAGWDEDLFDEYVAIADAYGHSTIFCVYEFAALMVPAQGWVSNGMKDERWNRGYLANYKGHDVVILPQSVTDATNTTKVIDPSKCYIIPTGLEKPVKIAFEGQTLVRTEDHNDDWSTDMHWYKKFGIATLANTGICYYQNTDLKLATH